LPPLTAFGDNLFTVKAVDRFGKYFASQRAEVVPLAVLETRCNMSHEQNFSALSGMPAVFGGIEE
jgi:hypothetical protein